MESDPKSGEYTQAQTEAWFSQSVAEARNLSPELLQQNIIELYAGRGPRGFETKELEIRFRAYNTVAVDLMRRGFATLDDGK